MFFSSVSPSFVFQVNPSVVYSELSPNKMEDRSLHGAHTTHVSNLTLDKYLSLWREEACSENKKSWNSVYPKFATRSFSSAIVLDDKCKQHSYNGTGLKALLCFARTGTEAKEIRQWLLALKTICVKLRLSTVRQGATQCYYLLCLWRFPDTEFASMRLIAEANFSKSQGLEFVAKASDLQWCQPPLTRCLCARVCLSACMCVCGTHWEEGWDYFTGALKVDGGWMALQMSINI